ncbi:MAG: PIN domain-containing protein [Pyrinomonadaceae bacterium]|nr:PIN domain-containing protein [Pyrinomonadaceae bacterium]
MSGTKAILDSNVIILASKEMIDVEEMFSRYDEFFASTISYAEVYAFEFTNQLEKDIADEIFANLTLIDFDKNIADRAIIYRKNKTKKIKLPDAIILASAKYANAEPLTDDWDDFQNIDSAVIVTNIDDLKI